MILLYFFARAAGVGIFALAVVLHPAAAAGSESN